MEIIFPSVDTADEDGLIGIGGDFSFTNLINAYKRGIFPWPINKQYPVAWFAPDPRGVLFTEDFKIPRSLKRFLNKTSYEIKYNSNFEKVIDHCASVKRKDQKSTWIIQELKEGYTNLFHKGHAYCVEVYDEKNLIGGVYGVCIGGFVSGESMFHLKANASKFALCHLMDRLKKASIPFLDTQMVTPVTQSLGAKEISREDFCKILDTKKPLTREAIFN